MKTRKINIFSRVIVLIFTLITALSFVFIGITYLATTHFYQEGTQLLNKDVAAHIAKFTSPFGAKGIDMKKADSVFYNAMVLSPSAEVYFLDTTGKVIAFHADKKDILLWRIPLTNVKRLIASGGKDYVKSDDPRDPKHQKIFSAAEVLNGSRAVGYIYVILGSNEYRNVTEMLYSSSIGKIAIEAFLVIVGISLVVSFFYIRRLQNSFRLMINVLERFQNGDFTARFPVKLNDELAPVTEAFNKMADLLLYNINNLKKSETDRKSFIANISHDLRTPLSIARGYTETLIIDNGQPPLTHAQREEYIHLVLNKIHQVENMVQQLFDLSKMEAAEYKIKKEPFVFSEILQELVETCRGAASKKLINIECFSCQNGSWIYADIRMMERVIQNLLVNSISYTPKYGIVKIRLENKNNELVFNIDNYGETLPDDLVNWINNDEHVASATRPAQTGLGLAIVKKIVQLHDYTLLAVSSTASGNHFSIRMNLYRDDNSQTN